MDGLSNDLGNNILFIYDDSINGCINITRDKGYIKRLERICTRYSCICCISYSFAGLNHLSSMYRQAKMALDRVKIMDFKVHYFSEYAFLILLEHLEDRNFVSVCLHPALKVLREYDQENETQFFETFKVYLQCERNLVETAKSLHVHRNTVVYRLGRILPMLDVDLNVGSEREYLLLSYRIKNYCPLFQGK